MQENPSRLPHSLVIRHAIPGDAGALVGLITQLAAHHGDQASTDEESLRADLFGSSPWAAAFVAEQDGGLLGYALLTRLYHAQFVRRIMDLNHLFVVFEARGCGIGKALIQAAMMAAEAEGCAQLVVGTHQDNQRVQGFYRALGFQNIPAGGLRLRLQLIKGT